MPLREHSDREKKPTVWIVLEHSKYVYPVHPSYHYIRNQGFVQSMVYFYHAPGPAPCHA